MKQGILEHGDVKPEAQYGDGCAMVKKLEAVISSGKLPPDCFLRKLLESQLDVALSRNSKAIRCAPR